MNLVKKIYRVKILDLKYLTDLGHLNFNYFIYEIETNCVEKAIKQAQSNYMKGL